MSDQFYNLIMASVPGFYSGDEGAFNIPKDRFLQYTEDHVKGQFRSLDQNAINKLKSLPTIFATEQEVIDARIGKITDIKVNSHNLQVKYRFDKDRYPISSGVLKENWQKLGIGESGYEFHRGHWAVKECNLSDFYEEYLKSLTGIAQQLRDCDKKVQLIYAFNGTGKTRLSLELKRMISPKRIDDIEEIDAVEDWDEVGGAPRVMYYNAFTEDLFYWDNDLEGDTTRKLIIQPNSYTQWTLQEQGQDQNAVTYFQRFTSDKLSPSFSPDFSEVTFSYERGDDERSDYIKISKGEESIFIWSIFYSLLEQIIAVLNIPETEERETDRYDKLEYVFIDDPVSSLDENNLIELAVNLADLIKSSTSDLKFIITTHSPLFYNVLYNELNSKRCYLLERFEDGTFALEEKRGDSNQSFSYHLHLKKIIEKAIADNQVEKFHFTLLRNLYEKTASFLGYTKWQDLLETAPGDKDAYLKRIITFSSHRTLSSEEVRDPTGPEKQTVKLLLDNLIENYGYLPKKEEENA